MSKLQEIKDQVAKKQYNASFHSICTDHFSDMIDEIAERYAKEMIRYNLARAADQAKVIYFVVGGKTDVGELAARVDKQSILETPIELL